MADKLILSFAPEDFVQGGLINDTDVLVTSAKWEYFDYSGQVSSNPAVALRLQGTVVGSDETWDQHISAGSNKDFVPTPEDDGDTLSPQGTGTALRKGSNFHIFVESLVKCGFPVERLHEGKASNFVGVKFHLLRVPAPKREGLTPSEGGREKTVVTCSKLLATPWDKRAAAAGSKKAAAASAPAAAAAAEAEPAEESGTSTADTAITNITEVLTAAGKALSTATLKVKLLAALGTMDAKEKQAIVKLGQDTGWLAENGFTVTEAGISI